jgi:hypothetical protein
MGKSDLDLIRLNQLLRILSQTEITLEERMNMLYEYLFQNENFRERVFHISHCQMWEPEALERGLHLVEDIIVNYIHYYSDLSLLQVTHYRKQRRVAAHLDKICAPLLKECLLRKGIESEPDLFLNEPIFAFKKEVRTKAYPKTKRGQVKVMILRDRFHQRLMNKKIA